MLFLRGRFSSTNRWSGWIPKPPRCIPAASTVLAAMLLIQFEDTVEAGPPVIEYEVTVDAGRLAIEDEGTVEARTPVIKPGDGITFQGPDEPASSNFEVINGADCATDTSGGVLSSTLTGILPLSRGTCELFQHNDFRIDPGPGFESALMVHVFGCVEANGFLALIGLGQVQADIIMEVIDLGDDLNSPDDDQVITSQLLSRHKILGELNPSGSASISADVGSATILTGGFSLGVSHAPLLCLEVVRDKINFDADLLLRRGHTYRLQLKSVSSLKLTVAGGLAFASFYSIENVPMNLLEPSMWLGGSGLPLTDLQIPNMSAASTGFTNLFTFPGLGFTIPFDPPVFVTIIPETIISLPVPFFNLFAVFQQLGIPTSLTELLTSDLFGFNQDFGDEEEILDAGVTLKELSLYIEEDVLEENLRARIERNLASDEDAAVGQFQLPQEFGGYLELSRAIVAATITNMLSAGQDIDDAEEDLEDGDFEFSMGNYKRAYDKFSDAYQEATEVDDDDDDDD